MKSINLLKRLASVVAGFLLGVSALSAQNITVTGTVTDALKEPIIGASVLQQGTTNGTATDIDGNFTLTVPHGAVIEISSIGFETRTLKADTEKMDVILVEDSEMLNETVVVGYGVQKNPCPALSPRSVPRISPPPVRPTASTPSRARSRACRSPRTAVSRVSSTPTSASAVTATR